MPQNVLAETRRVNCEHFWEPFGQSRKTTSRAPAQEGVFRETNGWAPADKGVFLQKKAPVEVPNAQKCAYGHVEVPNAKNVLAGGRRATRETKQTKTNAANGAKPQTPRTKAPKGGPTTTQHADKPTH